MLFKLVLNVRLLNVMFSHWPFRPWWYQKGIWNINSWRKSCIGLELGVESFVGRRFCCNWQGPTEWNPSRVPSDCSRLPRAGGHTDYEYERVGSHEHSLLMTGALSMFSWVWCGGHKFVYFALVLKKRLSNICEIGVKMLHFCWFMVLSVPAAGEATAFRKLFFAPPNQIRPKIQLSNLGDPSVHS